MSLDINNIVRTAAVSAIGLIVAVPISMNAIANGAQQRATGAPSAVDVYFDDMSENLVEACVAYSFSPVDSKLEREAKTTIDNYFDGDKMNYSAVCKAVFS